MKHPLSSKTIWGVIIAAAPLIALGLNSVGVTVSPAEIGVMTQQAEIIVAAATQIVGLAWAVYGRFQAKGPLKMK